MEFVEGRNRAERLSGPQSISISLIDRFLVEHLFLGSGEGDKTMPLSEDVRPLLAARAATDPNAAKLLEMFTKADEILSEHSLEGTGDGGKLNDP